MEIENIIRYAPRAVGLMEIENIIRYAPCAVGLMEIEHLIRSTARAVGLKPSAIQGEARLRGRERIIYSKTISPRLYKAKPACAGSTGSFLQRPQALGDGRRSPPAQARAEELFNDHHFVHPSPAQTHAEIMEIEHLIRYAPRAVGLMEIEH